MYEAHYGFREKPFNLTPDPKYLYLSRRHGEAFAHLQFGHRERGGFVVITGEVGTGKTTLARYFLGRLGPDTATAVVLYPALSAAELLRSTLQDLHIPDPGPSLKDLVDALHRFLLEARQQERAVVLLIDEAQDLTPEVLEQIRLLSNLETDTEKLIQIVLMGQSELKDLLGRRDLRQLAQRVTARYHLVALNAAETDDYIRHRLEVAGGAGKVSFSGRALDAVHRFSGGIPRLINLICDRALLAGYVHGTREITAAHIGQSAREVLGTRDGRAGWRPYGAAAAVAAFIAVAVASVVLAPAASAPPGEAPAPPARLADQNQDQNQDTHTVPLEPLLLTLPADSSKAGAVEEIRRLWETGPLRQTALRTHLKQVRRLDTPLVLEMFHPARRDTCYLALLHLENDAALVSSGQGLRIRVSLEELDRLWTRQAIFLWRDYDALADSPQSALASPTTWTLLTRLGYAPDRTNPAAAVARFQSDQDLAPDGVIGHRTLLALYSLGHDDRPRLVLDLDLNLGGGPS